MRDPVREALEQVADLAAVWFERHMAGQQVPILRRALVMACKDVSALVLAEHASFSHEVKQALKEADDPATAWVSQDEAKARAAERREKLLQPATAPCTDPTDADGFYLPGQGPKVDNDCPVVFRQLDGVFGCSTFGQVDWVKRGFGSDVDGWKPFGSRGVYVK